MKQAAVRKARVARVRRVQHLQAVGAAAVAEERLGQLEGNAARLRGLRESLAGEAGITSGAALGGKSELAMRLDSVRGGLDLAIGSAREAVALRSVERLDAHIARESAERLQNRAVLAMQALIEERMAAAFRPRRKDTDNG